jgi:inosine-uridine nucleoside N-ribohydrolase
MFNWFRHKAMDRELTEILDRHQQVRRDATDIRDYLLQVLADNRSDAEKFSDDALEKAAELIEQVGPGAFYWMTDIAAQMVLLSEATLRGFATNVSVELGPAATAEEIVQEVVRLP